jgi:hypothetical protein
MAAPEWMDPLASDDEPPTEMVRLAGVITAFAPRRHRRWKCGIGG